MPDENLNFELKPGRKVLIIDDDQANLLLMKIHLEKIGLRAFIADTAKKGQEIALLEQPDLIVLDVMMPDVDGYELCRMLKQDQQTTAIPVIFVSARDEEMDREEGLKLGGVDYLVKPYEFEDLKARACIVLRMLDLQERLVMQANTDELTGLANRRRFHELLEREVLRARSGVTDLSLMMLDLDHFKSINDTYGHLGGDIVLKQTAEIMREHVQQMDVPARYGGEEFIIILPNTTEEIACKSAERLRQTMAASHWRISMERIPITASIGVVTMEAFSSIDQFDLVKRADAAMYQAKRRGRNCVMNWKDMEIPESEDLPQTEEVRQLQGQVSALASKLRMQMLGSISALAKAMEAKDLYTMHHGEHVQIYAREIAEEMKLDQEFVEQVETAAQLHDIGKLSIPNEIIIKAGKLTTEERNLVMTHPIISVQILEPLGIMQEELRMIKHHHERFDGQGYPDGLREKRIPIGARIIAVADTYDAITANGVYRQTFTHEDAVQEIHKCSGHQFDPEVVEAFARVAARNVGNWPLQTTQQLVHSY